MKSLSRVQLFVTPWTVACQAPYSMGFSSQEYWSGLPFPFPGDLPYPGTKPRSPAPQADCLPSEPPDQIRSDQSLSRVWLCDPRVCSPPGSSVHGISQARILEWIAISFSRGSSWPRDWTHISCIGRWILNRVTYSLLHYLVLFAPLPPPPLPLLPVSSSYFPDIAPIV